jgi:glycosyltransferase involved in cell wall biosynthesis
MNIAIIAPPHIPVPPPKYGGTELFVAQLARGLHRMGHRVVVYANGESRLPCEVRSRYRASQWPISNADRAQMINLDHHAWAMHDAQVQGFDVVHANDAFAVHFARFLDAPLVLTLHHPHEPVLSELYTAHPELQYIAISTAQARAEPMSGIRVVHHGLDLDEYRVSAARRSYLCFLGRMAPCKAPHLAVEVARRSGIPLKLAGEIQPLYQDYWDSRVAPSVDGRFIEYVGEADLPAKNELLGGAIALVMPIEWEEPFGLVMIEAMACGTPVLAFGRGSVPEIVRDEVSGWICRDVADMAARATTLCIRPERCRGYVAERFSAGRMARRYEHVYAHVSRYMGVA